MHHIESKKSKHDILQPYFVRMLLILMKGKSNHFNIGLPIDKRPDLIFGLCFCGLLNLCSQENVMGAQLQEVLVKYSICNLSPTYFIF